jgi:hypothetical protein
VKCQHASDAVQGITSKFLRPYEGPFQIQRKINPAIYELFDMEGKLRGFFNIKHLKPYRTERDNERNFAGQSEVEYRCI